MSITAKASRTWKAIPAAGKAAFFSALVIGIITHMVGITNFFLNHDAVTNLFKGSNLGMGRWMAKTICNVFGGEITNPSTFLTLGILFIAISAGITVSVLRVRSPLFGALIGGLMVLFPTVVSTFSYIFSGLSYFCSLLFAVIAVAVSEYRVKPIGVILSIAFLTLSLGTYQAFISFAAGLFVLQLIINTFRGNKNTLDLLICGIKYVCILLASIACYYLVLQIALKITGSTLLDIRGVSKMDNIRFGDLPEVISMAYAKVVKFFVFDQYGENTVYTAWLYRGILLCGALAYLFLTLKTKLYRNIFNLCVSLILMLIFPLAIHLIAILGQSAESHWHMIYSFVLLPIMVIAFADLGEQYIADKNKAIEEKKNSFSKKEWTDVGLSLIAAAVIVVGLLQSHSWYVVTGECYTSLRLGNSAAYAAGIQLCADLTDAGYVESMPLAFVGDQSSAPFFATGADNYNKKQYTGIVGSEFATAKRRIHPYLDIILGFDFTQASNTEIETLKLVPDVIDMPVYPADGSIQVVDGIMVVKLSTVDFTMVEELDTSKIGGERQTEYESPEEGLVIEAGQDEKYKYRRICYLNEPNTTYILSCGNVSCNRGNVSEVDVIVYQRESKTIIAEEVVHVGQGFKWAFKTTDYVSDSDSKRCELLIYAGQRGNTNGNSVTLNGLRLEQVIG